MVFNLLNDRWYFIIQDEVQYNKIKLVCDYYGMSKYLPEKLPNNLQLIYNGYSFLDLMNINSNNFNADFKTNFTEVTLDDILNYDDKE